jgi:hypothetical protein
MKTINKTLAVLFIAFAMIGIYSSCNKEDNGGEPSIKYVRVTNPESSDSLLVGAGQGKLIAIVGENLGGAKEIWFNDQQASLTPTYISNTSILVSVPNPIPKTISNILKIIFSNGKVLEHRFEVQISKPAVSSMVSEHVNTGDVAVIRGNFFYAPLTVTFTGGVTGELVAIKDNH